MLKQEERQLFRLYRGHLKGIAAIHALVKWIVTPYDFIESFVPKAGKILDFGCGYGHFTNYLAIKSEKRELIGTDISDRKLSIARKTAGRNGVSFLKGFPEEMTGGDLDCALFLDVLCYIPYEEQIQILSMTYRKLDDSGTLIIREGDKKPIWKYWMAIVREKIMTKVVKLTHGDKLFFRSREEWEGELKQLGFSVETRRCFSGLFHPSILIIARKRTGSSPSNPHRVIANPEAQKFYPREQNCATAGSSTIPSAE